MNYRLAVTGLLILIKCFAILTSEKLYQRLSIQISPVLSLSLLEISQYKITLKNNKSTFPIEDCIRIMMTWSDILAKLTLA